MTLSSSNKNNIVPKRSRHHYMENNDINDDGTMPRFQSSIKSFFQRVPKRSRQERSGIEVAASKAAAYTTSVINATSSSTTTTTNTNVIVTPVVTNKKKDSSIITSHNTCVQQKETIHSNNNKNICNNKNSSTDNTVVSQQQQSQSQIPSKPKQKKKLRQLYLDLGQHNFGKQTICQICGMLTVHGVEEDKKEHEKICKEYRDGVPFHIQSQSCRIVATATKNGKAAAAGGSGYTIVEIRPSDSYALRQKVNQVMVIVDKELGFASSSSSPTSAEAAISTGNAQRGKNTATMTTTFLFIKQKRVVGLLSVEIIQKAHRLIIGGGDGGGGGNTTNYNNTSNNNEGPLHHHHHHKQQQQKQQQQQQQKEQQLFYQRSKTSYRAMLGVQKIWVHASVRKQHIASRLIDTARTRMVYGTIVPLQLVAFSSPTEAGAKFAQKYIQSHSTGINDNSNRNSSRSTIAMIQNNRTCTTDTDSSSSTSSKEEDKNDHHRVLVYDLPV